MKGYNISEEQKTQLKDAVKDAMIKYDTNTIIKLLVQQGYDPFFAQSIVEEAEEDDLVVPAKKVETTTEQDTLAEQRKIQAQQEEDNLNTARQQMLADQQQMADEDIEADQLQDIEEQQYFSFAKGGPIEPERTWSEKYQRMLTPQELAWLDQKFSTAQSVTQLYKSGDMTAAEKARLAYKQMYGDSFTCPNGQCDIPIGYNENVSLDPKTGKVTTIKEPIYNEGTMPILHPTHVDTTLQKFIGPPSGSEEEMMADEETLELQGYDDETQESEEQYYSGKGKRSIDPNFYIDMHGNRLDYRLPRFRKSGHSGDLIRKGTQRHLYIPSIERGPSTSFMIKGQNGIAVQTPQSFYDYALSERNRLMAQPDAWKGDPDFENPDGTFNLCIDCLNPNYENEQDLRDMNRLIEEGFTREIPHYGKDMYMQGLTKYGIPVPIPGSKKIPQNAYGGLYKAQFGIDVNPMPNDQFSQGVEQPYITWPTMEGDLMRDGGMPSKRSFLKKMTKHLMKANMGMEQASSMPSPYGDVSNPTASDISGKKNFISALNKQTQMFQAKQQAEQMYNNMYGQMAAGGDTSTENPFFMDVTQFGPPADPHDMLEHLHSYGESLTHELPLDTSMETFDKMQFGGFKDRRIKRANRALFGVPFAPPGASVDYEFGPLGGLRKASADIDISMLADMFKMLPGSPNANPFVTLPGVMQGMKYEILMNKGELVDDVISTVNNQSIKEVATATGNQVAQQKSDETPAITTSNVIPQSNPVKKSTPKPKATTPATTNKAALSNATQASQSGLPPVGKRPPVVKSDKPVSKAKTYYDLGSLIYRYGLHGQMPWFMEEGGFVDAENPNLYKFIYGGDDISIPYINNTDMYKEGGRILPQAQPGMSSFDQFRLQKMNPDGTLRNAPSLPGGEELMGNPYRQPQQSVIPNQGPNGFMSDRRAQELANMTSEQREAEREQDRLRQEKQFREWGLDPLGRPLTQQQFNPQQMQQYMQYMQQMSGNQMLGNPFAFGAPRGLGLGRAALRGLTGLSRDFNYFTGANPANWNVPEGYTKLRTETSKDRGKWYNPFDTKRVTTYEFTKPGEAGAPGTPGAGAGAGAGAGQPGANNYGTKTNTDGLSGRAARQIRQGERRTERQTERGREQFPDAFQEGQINPFAKTNTGNTPTQPTPTQPTPTASTPNVGSTNNPTLTNNSGFNQSAYIQKEYGDIIPEIKDYYDQNAVDATPEAASERVEAALARRNAALGFVDPSTLTEEGEGSYDPYGRRNIRPWDTNLNNIPDFNPLMSKAQKAANEMGMKRNPMMLGYADGGYVPDYYTFDGYLPMARPGIISDTPDFQTPQDPNAIRYTVEEQSGWSWDPYKAGNSLGFIAGTAAPSVLEGKQSVGVKRYGSNKQNYAEDIDRQLAYRGITDQEGIDKKAGFESGRTYTGKYGGQYKNGGPTYKDGGTYSLTQAQIDQIRKMGGDVEFI